MVSLWRMTIPESLNYLWGKYMKKNTTGSCIECSVGDALSSIKGHFTKEMKWREKAINLLRLVGDPAVDAEKLRAACIAHADEADTI